MPSVFCPSCGMQAKRFLVANDLNRKISTNQFQYYRCSSCLVITLNPIPIDLSSYYPPDYYHIPTSIDFLKATAPHEQYKLDLLKDFKSCGSLLEIGPSTGTFAWLAKNYGFEVQAIEMNPECCYYLNNIAGINTVESSDIEMALSRVPNFDVIVMWHVIEHLPDPFSNLNAISHKLNDGGVLVIAAPNPSALGFRILRKYWPHLDAPRHLHLIPPKIIVKQMLELGFQKKLETTCDIGAKGWNHFGWEYFVKNFKLFSKLKSTTQSKLSNFLNKIFSPFEGMEGNGSAFTLIFKK